MFVDNLKISQESGELSIVFGTDDVWVEISDMDINNVVFLDCEEVQRVYDRLGEWLDLNCVC